jgi:hypothetical protein
VINKTADKPPFRELAERELAKGPNSEAGPIPLKWYEESDDYCWEDVDEETENEA